VPFSRRERPLSLGLQFVERWPARQVDLIALSAPVRRAAPKGGARLLTRPGIRHIRCSRDAGHAGGLGASTRLFTLQQLTAVACREAMYHAVTKVAGRTMKGAALARILTDASSLALPTTYAKIGDPDSRRELRAHSTDRESGWLVGGGRRPATWPATRPAGLAGWLSRSASPIRGVARPDFRPAWLATKLGIRLAT